MKTTAERALIDALKSGDLETKARAVEEAADFAKELISEAINAFLRSPARLPLAERLLRFGPAIRPALEELLKTDIDAEARMHVSAVLLCLGSRDGVPCLIHILESGSAWIAAAAIWLSKARVSEAQDPIARALRKWDVVKDPYTAFTLIDSLKAFGPVPEEMKQRIIAECDPQTKPAFVKLLTEDPATSRRGA